MASSPLHFRSPAKALLGLAIGSALLAATGCGDDPSRMAGTIELPEKKITPPPDAKSFAKDKAGPKDQDR